MPRTFRPWRQNISQVYPLQGQQPVVSYTALYELASKKDHYPDNMFNSLEEYQEFLRGLATDFGVIDELTRKDAHSHTAKTLLPIAFKKLEKVFWTLWI